MSRWNPRRGALPTTSDSRGIPSNEPGQRLSGQANPLIQEWATEDRQALTILLRQARPVIYRWTSSRAEDLDGLRPCEVTRGLGKSQTTVRSSLCRARRRVRQLLGQIRRALGTQ